MLNGSPQPLRAGLTFCHLLHVDWPRKVEFTLKAKQLTGQVLLPFANLNTVYSGVPGTRPGLYRKPSAKTDLPSI